MTDNRPPAWMTGTAHKTPAQPPNRSRRPPAWMTGSTTNPPPGAATNPRPTTSATSPAPALLPPPTSLVAALPAIDLGAMLPTLANLPITSRTPGIANIPTNTSTQTSIALPSIDLDVLVPTLVQALPIPPIRPAPAVPTSSQPWMDAVITALQEVAANVSNSQFQAWANAPTDILTLVMDESGGRWDALKDEGYSSKLGRNFFAFGLFQINELWAPARYIKAPSMIGATLAKRMIPFPQTPTWTKTEATKALHAVPQQLWYAMEALREFSKFKNTYFPTVDGYTITGQTDAKTLPSAVERAKAAKIAIQVGHLAQALRVPASFVLLKAFWLASSPDGVLKLTTGLDARIKRAATLWPVTRMKPDEYVTS